MSIIDKIRDWLFPEDKLFKRFGELNREFDRLLSKKKKIMSLPSSRPRLQEAQIIDKNLYAISKEMKEITRELDSLL